ncbi:MAG: hypothetical protein ACRCS8_01475 [Brevinema sp.]
MALEQMFEHVQSETKKEADEQVNSVKVAMAKKLMAYGEELEKVFLDRERQLNSQLSKKEEVLKSEQKFQHKAQMNAIENRISDEVLGFVKESLLEFVRTDRSYGTILSSWLKKALAVMDTQKITVRAVDRDHETIKKVLNEMNWEYTLENSPINAGFIIIGETGEMIDLSFDVLFQERKEYLLQSALRVLKEKA